MYRCKIIIALLLSFVIQKKGISQIDTISIPLSDTFLFFDNLFSSNSELEMTLKFDIRAYQKGKYNDKYSSAQLCICLGEQVYAKQVRLKSRGTSRKQICSFPPYWLNVQRTRKKDKGYKVNYKLKVVSHCNTQTAYDDYLMREYLVYKIYNLLTPYSFKTRLVKFNYIDTGRRNREYSKWGFFIEGTDDIANRTNTREVKNDYIGFRHTQLVQTDLLSMFAFLMGNTDWSITGRQNIKVFQPGMPKDQEKLIPVPYDFDYSGFVNTYYSIPTEGLGIENVRERVYVGPCRELGNYLVAVQKLKDKKDAIYELINSFEYLSINSKKDLIKYLDTFYKSIKHPNYIKYFIEHNCLEIDPTEQKSGIN